MILAGHEPYPAVIVDRVWNLVAANAAALTLFTRRRRARAAGAAGQRRPARPPPGRPGPAHANLAEFGEHLLIRLQRQLAVSPRPGAAGALRRGAATYPGVSHESARRDGPDHAALRADGLRPRAARCSRCSAPLATFGTALDITLAELSIESFFPADAATEAYFRP